MQLKKTIYWGATGIMCAVFAFSAFNYFLNYPMIRQFFESLGFPGWLIYPLAVLKILGLVAILSNLSAWLREWAYAGFFFDAALALAAHQIAGDGQGMFAIIALTTTLLSRALLSAR